MIVIVFIFEFRENGSLIIAHAEDKHLLSRFSGILPKNDQWSAIQGEAIRTLEPSLDADIFSNGLHLKAEGHLHPRKAMEALRNFLPPIIQKHIVPEDIVQDFNLVIDCRGMGACDYIDDLRGVKGEILIVILILLLTFYIVITWGAKQKAKSDQSIKIKSYLFGVRILIIIIAIVSLILWFFL